VARWTSDYYAQRVTSSELRALAADANAYRFKEFADLLPTLTDDERRLALRLAVLPMSANEEIWKALREVVLERLPLRHLDSLKRRRLLEIHPPPSYGHARRSEAALKCFADQYREELREESESLIIRLGSRVRHTDSEVFPFVDALVALFPIASDLEFATVPLALCQLAFSLAGTQSVDHQALLSAVKTARVGEAPAPVAPLMAMGLIAAMYDDEEKKALEWHDAALDEFRQLAYAYPGEAIVRQWLVVALVGAMADAKRDAVPERRDPLLDELRQLAQIFPQDAAVRDGLANGLHIMLNDAKSEGARQRCDALLKELREIARSYPDDAVVREQLVMSLYNMSARPGNILVVVRDPWNLHHVRQVLAKTDTTKTDVVVMKAHLRALSFGGDELMDTESDTKYELELFTPVVNMAEKEGKHISLLVVPTTDPFQATVATAQRLDSSVIFCALSNRLTADEQGKLTADAWERLPEPRPRMQLVVVDPYGTLYEYSLGPHLS
jgi:hypothetical protein